MHRAVIITGLMAITLLGAAVLHFAGGQKPTSRSNSSIIEIRSEADALQLREQARLELDEVEALFDAATSPQLEPGIDAFGQEREVQAGVRDNPPAAPVSVMDEPVWFELAAYESLRDARLAAVHSQQSRTAVVALPLLPVSSSFSGAGRGAVGIPATPAVGLDSPPLDQTRERFRASSLAIHRTAPAIALVRLAYFALRNGYHGGAGASLHESYPSRNFFALSYRSRTFVRSVPFSFFQSILKATAFEISVTGQIHTACDSQTHIGDVA